MANDHYTRGYDPQPTQRVGSTDLKNEFQAVEGGFDSIQADTSRTLRQVGGAEVAPMPNAISRALKLLSFDAAGNPEMVAGGGRYRGDWVTATAYVVSDYFRDATSKNIYSTVIAHTAGVLATDIADGKVRLAINVEDVELAKAAAETAAAEAETQVALAAAQVAIAEGQAGIATTKAGEALASANDAASSATAAAASYDAFDDRYLGSKTADPTLDNDGNALLTGALYWNSVANEMRVYSGSAWAAAYLPASGYATLNGTETLTNKTIAFADNTLTGVQPTLVSGTNIKTVNGSSVLGSGDLTVGGGSWVLLSTVTASSSATVDIETTFDSTYDSYVIVANGVLPATNEAILWARLKVNGSYQSASYVGVSAYPNSGGANSFPSAAYTVASPLNQIPISFNGGSTNESNGGINLSMHVSVPSSTSVYKQVNWIGTEIGRAGNSYPQILLNGSARYNGGTQALTGVRFLFSTGNIASGSFRLYGIKKA